jgi:hypothetical protein
MEELASSFAVLKCSHRFHIACLVNWFATQSAEELPQNCPCCRTEAGVTERLPEQAEGEGEGDEDEDDDETDGTFEENELMLTRSDLDTILRTQGGVGVMDSLWFAFFDAEQEHLRIDAEYRLPFVSSELSRMIIYQGGRDMSDERWEELVETYDPSYEADEDEEPSVDITREQMETLVVAAGGVGVSPAQWAELVAAEGEDEGTVMLVFYRSELDAYLARADQSGQPLTDVQWNALLPEDDAAPAPSAPPAPAPAPLRITWRRFSDGHWERIVLNPETDEAASWGVGTAEPPPEDLVEQTSAVASRFQALWHAFQEKKRKEARAAAAKIQAIWRGHQQRQHFHAFLALSALRLAF